MPVLNIKRFSKLLAAPLAVLFVLTGCASTPVSFNSREQFADNLSVVFIYRPDTLANIMVTPGIMVDGATSLAISNNQYQVLKLPAGQHHFKLELTERYQGNTEITLETGSGQSYFLRIDSTMKFQQNRPYDRSFNMLSVTEAEATPQISLCKPAATSHSKHLSQPVSTETPGYSSQTFRNPFSR